MRERVAVRLVLPILKAAQADGGDRARLLRQAGVVVRGEDPAACEERVTLAQYLRLWEEALAAAPAGFPLRAATALGPESFGVIGFACITSRTLGEAFARSARYHVVCTDSSRWSRADEDERAALVFEQDGPPGAGRDAAIEFALAEALHQARAITGARVEPVETQFARPRPADDEPQRRYFGGQLRWSAPRNALVVQRSLLAQAIPKADPHMLAFFDHQAQALVAKEPEEEPIAEAVRRAIVATLPSGTPTLPQVARSLGLSERTLRRRLAEQRTSFQDLLEGCRSSLAGRYLERKDLALAEIAFLLGFSEPSPFYRAFRRWFGLSPERYRQGLSMQ
jgi:AraC-like DNA-binding protein